MTATVTISQDDVMTTLRSFIMGLITGCEVIQGLPNGVAPPVDPFIQMTPLFFNRLSTNIPTFVDVDDGIGLAAVEQHVSWAVQIDCYGPLSNDWAVILTTMLRDEYGVTTMAPDVAPLYTDDPKQLPIVDGEQNYEQRWMITAYLQYNPVVVIPMQFFNAVSVNLINVSTIT